MPTADTLNPAVDTAAADRRLSGASPSERVAWAFKEYGNSLVLSTSFGAQAAVMLHLATQVFPDIPVVFVDTGYLFPETYRFADELTSRLKVNLKVYRATESPAWIEARHGKLWEQGAEGLARYNQIVKVSPMQRALAELGARAALPSSLGKGLRLHRRRPHYPSSLGRDDTGGYPILRLEAGVRAA